MKDTTGGGSYVPSSVSEISEDAYLNSTAYDQKFDTIYAYIKDNLPLNPTRITSITFTAPGNINKGQSVSVTLSNIGLYNVYDCTTWGDVYKTISHKYFGYKKSQGSYGTTQTKTFLVRGSAAAQNFAFEMDDYE